MNSEVNRPVPRTEESLQALLAQISAARAAGDEAGVGYGLIALIDLVKWVRSDNHQEPFDRAHTLALEALSIFRRIGDAEGQISALIEASPFEDPRSSATMLLEAQQLASDSGSESQLASVLAARGRCLALHNADQSNALTVQALEIYRRLGDVGKSAQCLFSLAITRGTTAEKVASALEAARLYRQVGNLSQAEKSISIAFWNAEELGDVLALEPEVRLALEESQATEDRCAEGRCYGHLARIAATKGNAEDADRYRRWHNDLLESDGLTPLERWKMNVAMSKVLLSRAKRTGNKEAIDSLKASYRRLKEEKP